VIPLIHTYSYKATLYSRQCELPDTYIYNTYMSVRAMTSLVEVADQIRAACRQAGSEKSVSLFMSTAAF